MTACSPPSGPWHARARSGQGGALRAGIWGGHFECADGRWVHYGSGNQNFREFVEAAGIADWDREGLTDIDRILHDTALYEKYPQRTRELFKTRTAQEWEDLVAEAGSECAVCRTSAEWFEHPHARESHMVIEVDDPIYGPMLQPGMNARLSRTPGAVRRAALKPDQHRVEILQELEARPRPAPPAQLLSTLRSALDGVRVLDLCIILAGPTWVEPWRNSAPTSSRSTIPAAAAMSSPTTTQPGQAQYPARPQIRRRPRHFLEAGRHCRCGGPELPCRKIGKLGLGYEHVRQRKPDIIYASLNA